MKSIQRIQTFDGVVHLDVNDAKKHLDKKYRDLLHKISIELSQHTHNYSSRMGWIDENLNLFDDLKRIKNDFILLNDGDDWELE